MLLGTGLRVQEMLIAGDMSWGQGCPHTKRGGNSFLVGRYRLHMDRFFETPKE